MRFHILDPQLNFADGHFAAYDAAVAAELERRGTETVVYGNVRPEASLSSRMDARPLFSRGMFEEAAADRLTWALENFVNLGKEFHSDLKKVELASLARDDVAFFPNIIQYQINGIADWIADVPQEQRPTLVLKLSYLTFAMPYLQQRPNKEMIPLIYRFAMRRLVECHPRTRFCSDTEEMVKQFAALSNLPIQLLPMPLLIEAPDRNAETKSRANVVFLGHASMLKGFHLIPQIVRRGLAAADAPHFVIQSYGEARLCANVEKALDDVPADGLTLVRGAVDAVAYRRLLHSADIVLFPYAPEFYGWASSGIFAEAMSLGKVAVVTSGTWPARQLETFAGGGVVSRTLDAEGVAAATLQAVRTLPQLRERAARAAPAWRKHHSPANFVDRLLALTP
jgi:glycosyltransferase involved in cell wall biosynthesis